MTEVTPADSDGLPALNYGWEYRTFILDVVAFLRAVFTPGP